MPRKSIQSRREYQTQYYLKNRKRMDDYKREWNIKNRARRRERGLRKLYGMSLVDWTLMFEKQHQACAICEKTEPGTTGWQTDHCHRTNKVRAILCHACNMSLGGFKDSPLLLRRAAEYVEEHW